jgi:deoxyribodipyrimidine photo-lyase
VSPPRSVAIWWIRRDLRLHDNPALLAASAEGTVVPVFLLDESLLGGRNASQRRNAFLFGGMRSLDKDLRARGSRLVVRKGRPADALAELTDEVNARVVFAEADISPYARRRDVEAAQRLPLVLTGWPTVHDPAAVLKRDGTPYTVFTPFGRAWRSLPLPGPRDLQAPPDSISTPADIAGLSIPQPEVSESEEFPPGEAAARQALSGFTEGALAPAYRYAIGRDRVDLEGTSGLSPYLRFGMLSARQAVVAALDASHQASGRAERESADIWLNQLIWREFFAAILFNFPHVGRQSFRADLRSIQWENDPYSFEAWRTGQTGYPLVDAGMRQLAATGWMHNRARMVVASFLVKDLLVDWRWGERWFMQQLLDGDPASNNGGWQWTAGTGTDAAPYFRVFNPTAQAQRHDPDGIYIRRWVPELRQVPESHIHQPWEMPAGVQHETGCRIGVDYPHPLLDHGWARARALAAYGRVRSRPAPGRRS